jgi:GntR family transcriptional repressor for pyruvate dehydrogenase complex
VIEEIREMMRRGDLKEGDKLPNQNEFAAQLGVSRASLREALHTLTLIGAIEQRPGFGTVIRARVPTLFADHLTPPLMSDIKATVELVEARRFIEIGCLELAVFNRTEEQLRLLEEKVAEMSQALKDNRAGDYVEQDMAFHYQIALASHNRFLIHLFVTIRGFLEQFMQESFSVLPGMYERSFAFHRRIFKGIKEKNLNRALKHMRDHIIDIQRGLEHYYKVARKDEAGS